MSNQYGPRIVTNGLLLYLDAANTKSYSGSGTTWSDLSGNNNNGILTNGPIYNNTNQGTIVLDGINDFISISTNSSLSPNTRSFSIDLWIRISALLTGDNVYLTLFQKGRIGNSSFEYGLVIGKHAALGFNNHILLALSQSPTGSSNTLYNTGFNNIILNNWYNFVAVKNSTVFSFYLNGNFISSTTVISNVNSASDPLVIGATSAASQATNCSISNARLYMDKALSASEVLQNYNALKGRFNL